MNRNQTYSMMTTNFMILFRKFIKAENFTSIQQYFEKQKFGNIGQISRLQFQKIIQHFQSNLNLSVSDIIEIFKQLSQNSDFISIKKFIHIYNLITSKVPSSQFQNKKQKQEEQKRRIQQEKQKKNQIIRVGLKKLQSFILENDPMQMFEDCDQNSSGRLNIHQFNNFLILTGIKEFEDKTIRKILLAQIFSYFPSKHISRDQFINFFKIPKQKIQKKAKVEFFIPPEHQKPNLFPEIKKVSPTKNKLQNKTHEEKSFNIPENNIKINIKPTQNKNITFNNNEGFKKKNAQSLQKGFKPQQLNTKVKEQVIQNLNKDQLIKSNYLFPEASVYFRNGQPVVEQLKYLQQLQNLLIFKKTYKDSQNPITNKGQYVEARNFFKGMNYRLFQMAQSVLQRQVSRIGLARQIQPKDIIQGQIGDCYFLSSIASLISIYPEVISEKFLFNQNPANYFVIKLFLDGQWKYIATDDYFPSKNGKEPVFAKPHGKEIWVMILEKCWAKCFGNFQAIVSGSPRQAFIALTGAPTQYFSLKSKQTTKQFIQLKIKQAYECRYVITASGSDHLESLSQIEQQKIGLISSHAYSFLKFINVNGNSLVKIRNPWGTRIWKGQWSFESKKWTKQLRNKFNYNRNPQDGSFFMDMNDFLKYFGSFVICKVNPIYLHTRLSMNHKKHKSNYTRIKVSQSGKYIISLYQQNDRNMKQKYSNYDYSPARIILMKIGEVWEYIDSYQNLQSYSTSIEVDLKENSEYIVSTKVKWKFWPQHKACLTIYGPEKVIIQASDNSMAPVFKYEMIESFYKKNRGKVKDYNKTGAIGSFSQSFFSLQKGIGYYFITNPSEKKWALTYSLQGTGIKVIKPDTLPFNFVLTKDSRFLKGFFTSPEGYNYQSSQTMTY